MKDVIVFIYSPLMIFLWIIVGFLCLLKATRSGILLSPTPEGRRIKVIYYYLCFIFPLVVLGIYFILFSFCLEYIRSHAALNAIVRLMYQLTMCLIAPVYCALSVGFNRWINNQNSLPQSNSAHRAASLDRYVDRAYLAAMASVFFACVPPIFYFSLFYSGPLFFLPYIFTFLFFALAGGLYWFHHRRMLPLLRGGETALSPQGENFRGRRNGGIFFGDIALIGLVLLLAEYFLFEYFLFSPNAHVFELSALGTAASAVFVCVLFLAIGLWSGVPGKRCRTFMIVGAAALILDVILLWELRHSPNPQLRSTASEFPFFPYGIILLCAFGSLIVSGIAGLVDYRRRAPRRLSETTPEPARSEE